MGRRPRRDSDSDGGRGVVTGSPILVDTSAWIEFLRGTGSQTNVAVRSLIETDRPMATTDIVAMELLMGASSPTKRGQIWSLLNRCIMFPTRPLFEYERAAELYIRCRGAGFTPANTNDLLIAAVAIAKGVAILDADSNFEQIAAITPLRRYTQSR